MLYRIVTERRNPREIAAITARHFDGFTVLHGTGYWKGEMEASLVIEIETDDMKNVNQLAQDIKVFNEQQAVMVQQVANHAWLI